MNSIKQLDTIKYGIELNVINSNWIELYIYTNVGFDSLEILK